MIVQVVVANVYHRQTWTTSRIQNNVLTIIPNNTVYMLHYFLLARSGFDFLWIHYAFIDSAEEGRV